MCVYILFNIFTSVVTYISYFYTDTHIITSGSKSLAFPLDFLLLFLLLLLLTGGMFAAAGLLLFTA